MTKRARVSKEAIARVEALASRTLTAEELRAWADGPIGPEELEESVALIRWFLRRYPTPAERLKWGRRQTESLRRTMAHARGIAPPE
jgi:hypothetical protein